MSGSVNELHVRPRGPALAVVRCVLPREGGKCGRFVGEVYNTAAGLGLVARVGYNNGRTILAATIVLTGDETLYATCRGPHRSVPIEPAYLREQLKTRRKIDVPSPEMLAALA